MTKRGLREQLVTLKPNGVVWDVPPHELPPDVYSIATNMRFDDDAAVKFSGFTDRNGTTLFPPVFMAATQRAINDQPTWGYGGLTQFGVTDGTAHFDLTPPGGINAALAEYTITTLNSIPVINPITDIPYWWDGDTGGTLLELPDWDPTWACSSMRSFKNFLLAIGMTGTDQYGDVVRWSTAADPGTVPQEWVPSPTNSAGSIVLAATRGDVIEGLALRDQFVLYKAHSTYVMQFIGGQFIMQNRKFLVTSGILSRNCVVEHQGFHYVLTDDDVIRHDGHTVESIVDKRAKKYIFDTMSPQFFNRAFVANNAGDNEVWFCWPEGDSPIPTTALVYNTALDDFGIRTLPSTDYITAGFTGLTVASGGDWESDAQAWDLDFTVWNEAAFSSLKDGLIGCSSERSAMFVYDDSPTENGAIVTSYLERTGLDLGSPERVKLVKAVWPRITGEKGEIINIRVGSQLHASHPIVWSAAVPFTLGVDDKVDTFAQGRYLAISFSSTTDNIWRLWAFDLETQQMGFH